MYKIETMHRYSSPITISGDWVMRSNQLRKDFPTLTEADLLFERGREEELISRLETKLNKNREEVISILKKGRLERI